MKLSRLFGRRRGPATEEPNPLTARRESSPDVHQLKSTRRRNGVARRPTRRDGAFMNMPPTPPSSRVIANDEHPPCVICRAVDFPSLLDWRPGNPRPWVELSHTITQSWVSVAPLKPGLDADSMTESSAASGAEEPPCPYCTFFRLMIGQLPDETGKFTPYLRIRQAFEKLGVKEKAELGRAVLAEVSTKDKALPWGWILKAADDASTREGEGSVKTYLGKESVLEGRVVPELLDPLVPRTWMDFCRENHNETCAEITAQDDEDLRLVDCESRRVVLASALGESWVDNYAALSYAWTGNDEDLRVVVRGDGQLAGNLPTLFTDAISITKKLGLRYLWIDKLCLPPDETARQSSLTLISDVFARAAVALVPATDDLNGIPGVSVPREEQLSLQTDAGLFTTSLIRPDLEVASCQWATQTRTFQEGLFARRRLIFTPSQCYFQCCAMHCHESIGMSLHLAPSLNLGRVFAADGGGTTPGQFKDQVRAYIPRESATDEERLLGFEGVLSRYRLMEKSVDELLGVPLFHFDDFNNEALVSQTDRLAVGLGWLTAGESPAAGSVEPYYYPEDTNGMDLPSWTWLSWRVRPGYESVNQAFQFSMVGETSPIVAPGVSAAPQMEVLVGFADGKLMSWEIDGATAVKKKRATATGRISYLRVLTWCFDLPVRDTSEQQKLQQPQQRRDDENETGLVLDCHLPKNARERVLDWYRAAVPEETKPLSTPIADALSSKPLPDPENNGALPTQANGENPEEPPKASHRLIGMILSGRGWKEASPTTGAPSSTKPTSTSTSLNNNNNHNNSNAAFTVLICVAGNDETSGPAKLRRLGALHVPCDGFASVAEKDAILRGVATDAGEKKALKLDLREVDLW